MSVIAELYNGKVIIEFNPAAHRYKVGERGPDGTIIFKDALPDGVTTICSAVIPKFLDDWAGRVCVDHVRQGYFKYLEEHGLLPGEEAFLGICADGEGAHRLIRDHAGDRGSKAHDYIEEILTGEDATPPDDPLIMASLNAFSKWQDSGFCKEIIAVERIIHSREFYYCGKVDVFGVTGDGAQCIVDFKTGSGFYDDHPYQLTGYAVALEEEGYGPIEKGYIIHLDKKTGDYDIYPVEIDDGMKDAWKRAVLHYKDLKTVRKNVKEIKDGMGKGWRGRRQQHALAS